MSQSLDYVYDAVNLICVMILGVAGFVHTRKHYQDFFTESRKSLSHRREKPQIDIVYKLQAGLVLCNIIFGFTYAVVSVIMSTIITSESVCRIAITIYSVASLSSKWCIYAVFAFRLHSVYSETQFAVRPLFLKFSTMFIFVYFFIFGFIVIFGGIFEEFDAGGWEFEYTQGSNSIDNYCFLTPPVYAMIMWGFFDFVVNLVYCILFIKPIREVIRRVQGSSRTLEEKSKLSKKMLLVALKVAILAVTVLVSTLVIGFFFAISINISNIDIVINTISLILMTPYYADEIYYRRVCCMCIFCCDWWRLTNKLSKSGKSGLTKELTTKKEEEVTMTTQVDSISSNESGINESNKSSQVASSVDTHSAVRVAAHADARVVVQVPNVEVALAQNIDN